MSQPPFTMSKYANETDLLRDKCAWLERELAEANICEEGNFRRAEHNLARAEAACAYAGRIQNAAQAVVDEFNRGSQDAFGTVIGALEAALAKNPINGEVARGAMAPRVEDDARARGPESAHSSSGAAEHAPNAGLVDPPSSPTHDEHLTGASQEKK